MAVKTKLQILKESIVYIFVLGFSGSILHFILNPIFGNGNWVPLALSGFVSFVATCVFMGYIFEKEKPLWLGTLQYVVIGIFSALFTLLIIILGIPFVFDFLLNQTSNYFKSQMGNSGIAGILLIIPLIILSFFFVIFGLIAYLVVTYFLGNLIFSFLMQWALSKYQSKSS